MEITQVIEYLKNYDGRQLKLMEVCGTHTAAIFKNGIRDLISPKIKLITEEGGHATAFIEGGEKARSMLHTFIEAYFEA